MIRFFTMRSLQMGPTLLVAVTLIFFIIHLTPGDPVLVILRDYYQQDTYAAVAARLGLDQPVWVQYFNYLGNLLQGDWGTSFRTKQDVLQTIAEQVPYTVQLALTSLGIAVIIGVPAGVISAIKQNTWADYAAMLSALVAICMPSFWIGILLILVFSVNLGWTPIVGAGDSTSIGSILLHLALPAFALGARMAALIARITRASILDVMHQDFVRTARAKGLSEQVVLSRHTGRVALIPVLTVIGLDLGNLLGGSAIVEIVFSRPGVGKILVDALLARDFPLIQGSLILLTAMVLMVNLLTDFLYSAADPRIRLN